MSIYTIDTSDPNLDWKASGDERIVQNVLNLIRTFRYEVGYDRTRGINPAVIDKPMQEAAALYTSEIFRVIDLYEPRASVNSVNFIDVDLEGNMQFKVAIEI